MSATTEPTLAERRDAVENEIKELVEERDRLYDEFQARVSAEDVRPSDEEVRRFTARKTHEDKNVRPSEDEVRRFEERQSSKSERPTDDEVREFNAAHERRKAQVRDKLAELKEFDDRLQVQGDISRSREIAAKHSRGEFGKVELVSEPLTYRADNERQHSYFLDLAAAHNSEFRSIPGRVDGWEERLNSHSKQMEEVLPKRAEARKRRAEEQIEQAEREFRGRYGIPHRGFDVSPFERWTQARSDAAQEQRAPTRIVGQGGYGIPPLWLIQDYIPALRPGRVAAGLCRQMTLPEGTDSINIPRLLTPTLTGVQGADAAPVTSRDFSDTFQQANVKTIVGQEDVPIQLIEQSPGQILDSVIITDLLADLNKQVDLQVLVGSGVGAPLSGGQVVGLYPATNWGATAVTFAGSTMGAQLGASAEFVPAQAEFFQFLAAMASKTAYNRFNLRDFNYVMHPRRHFWSISGLDALGRPLGSDDGFGPFNSHEIEVGNAPFEGYAGRVPFGPSVYIDANVPITDNGSGASGGSNDVVIGAIWDDCWLFEGDLRTRVLSEVLSGTLEMRFQAYEYVAFLARYGVSITIGTAAAFGQPYTYSGSSNGAAY